MNKYKQTMKNRNVQRKNVMQSDNAKNQKRMIKGNKDTLEKIDQYVMVATPSIWLMLIAMLIVLIVVLIWGNVGRVPLNLTTNGVGVAYNMVDENGIMIKNEQGTIKEVSTYLCFIDPRGVTSHKLENKEATVVLSDGTRHSGHTVVLTPIPCDYDEVTEILEEFFISSHWVREKLEFGEYRYIVNVELDQPVSFLEYGNVAKVIIEVGQVPPIYYLSK